MNSSVDENPPLRERMAEVFARLPEQAIEQFYAQYQLWLLRRRVPLLQKQIEAIDEHLAANQQVMRSLQPSAIALAVLARLQANGVSTIELLDLLLSRGEDWLDRMMQRLDYCEQVRDFIQGDYTQWCYRSLDGAYDWIDTLLGSVDGDEEPRQAVEGESEATEELLLRKLRLDDEDEMLEVTFREPVTRSAEDNETAEPSAPVAQSPLASLCDEQPGEGQRLSEQAPELVDWADLDAPGERPAPWYGGSQVLEEEPRQASTDALEGASPPSVAEQAAVLPGSGEAEDSPGDEIPLSIADIGLEDANGACDVVHDITASHTSLAALQDQQAEKTVESGQTLPVDSETQESADVAPQAEQSETEEEDRLTLSAAESRFASGRELERTDGDRDAEENGEALPDVATDTNLEERTEQQDAETDVLLCEEESGPVEREELSGEREPLPAVQADGTSRSDLVDPQEEQRPWYEYLELHQPAFPARPAPGERVEPEEPSLTDEATQPVMLNHVQRARAQTDAPVVHDVSGRVHLSADDTGLSGGDGTRPAWDVPGEVRDFPGLAVPEVRHSELPERERTGEMQMEAAGGSPSPRRIPPASSWPPNEEAPQKQGFWQRFFAWLPGKRAQP
jgi:hypothetical protein